MRLRGMMRKEAFQILRDPSSIGIAFVMPVVLLLIFGYGVSLDAKHIPVALVIEESSTETAGLAAAFENSAYFSLKRFQTIQTAERALEEMKVDAIVWLRWNFSRDLLTARTAAIGVFIDGVDANTARIIQGYIEGVWRNWLQQYAAEKGVSLRIPVELHQRTWFNPALRRATSLSRD